MTKFKVLLTRNSTPIGFLVKEAASSKAAAYQVAEKHIDWDGIAVWYEGTYGDSDFELSFKDFRQEKENEAILDSQLAAWEEQNEYRGELNGR
jgi:hypothetical protein